MNELILVVDDQPMNSKLVSFLLTAKGYEVLVAANGEEALDVLGRVHPRLILMDVQLPGMSGLDLTRKLKADPATSDIIVVALTAYAMKGDEARVLAAGCDGYLSKPIDTRALPGVIARYLAERLPTATPP